MSCRRHYTPGQLGLALLKLLAVTTTCGYQIDRLCAQEIALTSPANVKMNDLPGLTGVLDFSTNVPTRVGIRVQGAREGWTVDSSKLRTDHSFPLLGFEPDSQYNLSVTLADANGVSQTLGDRLSIETAPLPPNFPHLELKANEASRMEPGYTLVPADARGDEGDGEPFVFASDAQGKVRWYLDGAYGLIRRQQDGGLLIGGNVMREMDFLGNVSQEWYTQSISSPPPGSVTIQTQRVHHDTFPLPDGNFLALITGTQTIDNFPTSADANAPRETTEVTDTPIIEFARDGSIVQQFNMLDILDPTRIGYDVFRRRTSKNWAWGNAIIYDESDDSIIVSLRHQDAVVKFSRSTGEPTWILGNHDNWGEEFEELLLEPVGEPFEWQYHQHAPMLLPNGNILVHDNGNHRASPPDPKMPESESYTRAVEYAINEETMEITQVWEYGRDAEERIYSPRFGDADWLSETDNVLITFGSPSFVNGISQDEDRARIVEVARDGEVVFDLEVSYPDDEKEAGVYRSDRIPALYPSEYAVASLLLGDIDDDGIVKFDDFLILSANFGMMGGFADGDIDGDGEILFSDFLLMSNNFGKTAASAAAVPEPTSAMILLVGMLGIATRRSSRPRFG